MKRMVFMLIMLSVVNFANAQKEDCISIIETNLNEVITNIVNIMKDDNKIIVLSEKDDKKYKSIILNNSTEFKKQIEVGDRISIRTIEGIKYICVAKEEKNGIIVKRFTICK